MTGSFTVPPAGEGSTMPHTVAKTVKVVLAVETPELRARIARAIRESAQLELIERCELRLPEAAVSRSSRADVLVLETLDDDMARSVRNGRLREPDARILFISVNPVDAPILQLLQAGVHGILTAERAAATVVRAVQCVAAGQYWIGRSVVGEIVQALARRQEVARSGSVPPPSFSLTAAEAAILDLIAAGCSNKDIAEQRNITSATVKSHLTSIFQKTGTTNRLQLAMLAVKRHCEVA